MGDFNALISQLKREDRFIKGNYRCGTRYV